MFNLFKDENISVIDFDNQVKDCSCDKFPSVTDFSTPFGPWNYIIGDKPGDKICICRTDALVRNFPLYRYAADTWWARWGNIEEYALEFDGNPTKAQLISEILEFVSSKEFRMNRIWLIVWQIIYDKKPRWEADWQLEAFMEQEIHGWMDNCLADENTISNLEGGFCWASAVPLPATAQELINAGALLKLDVNFDFENLIFETIYQERTALLHTFLDNFLNHEHPELTPHFGDLTNRSDRESFILNILFYAIEFRRCNSLAEILKFTSLETINSLTEGQTP